MATKDADMDLILVFKSGVTDRISFADHRAAMNAIRAAVNAGSAWVLTEDLILNLSELAMVAPATPEERGDRSLLSGTPEREGGDAGKAMSITQFLHQQNISRSHLYKLIKDGKGPRLFRLGKRVLITQEAAAEWRASIEAAHPPAGAVHSTARPGVTIGCATATDASPVVYVKDLGFPRRTAHWLMAAGIITVEDLLACSFNQVLNLPNIGRKTVMEIREVLKTHGLSLMGDA